MKFTPNLVVGIVITLVGSVLVLDRLGFVDFRTALQLWPVLLTVFGVSVIVQSMRGGGEPGSPSTQRPIVGPGLVLFIVIVGFLGWRTSERRAAAAGASGSDASMSLVGIMSADARITYSPDFRGAQMLSVMGATRLDLRKAGLAAGQDVEINVVAVMGGVEIFVPREWNVDMRAVAVMGGKKDQRSRPTSAVSTPDGAKPDGSKPDGPKPDGPRLIVTGVVVMGGLEIKS